LQKHHMKKIEKSTKSTFICQGMLFQMKRIKLSTSSSSMQVKNCMGLNEISMRLNIFDR